VTEFLSEAIVAGYAIADWLADPADDEKTHQLQRNADWLSGCGPTARRIARDAALEALEDAKL